jgi:hypothetical protein
MNETGWRQRLPWSPEPRKESPWLNNFEGNLSGTTARELRLKVTRWELQIIE